MKLDEKIAKLREQCGRCLRTLCTVCNALAIIDDLQAENERLRDKNQQLTATIAGDLREINLLRQEAIAACKELIGDSE